MNTHRTPILLATLMLALPATALASPARGHAYGHFKDQARVIASVPIYQEYNAPRQECWTERTGYYESRSDRSYTGAIIGGIAGGLLGNQIGKGNGKVIATAAGAVTGAMVGDNLGNDGRRVVSHGPRYEERCRTVDNWSRQITGYNVTYRYQGRDYSSVLPYDPGNTVRVRVKVDIDD